MRMSRTILAAIALAACAVQSSLGAELLRGTLKAWKAYLKGSDLQMRARVDGRQPFLWIDESPDRAARVRHGEVVVAPVTGNGMESVPHGLVHDWIGAVFIPGATIDNLWAVVHDYDDYQHIYRPVVTSSRTLACSETGQEFQMVWRRKILFVNAAIEGRYQASDVMLDAHRGYSLVEAVEMQEIDGYGHKNERLLPPDIGNGFIWRIRSLARYEERDGGVYLELNATALTRNIPASIAWMVNPVVNHLSVTSLATTLRQTRDAVVSVRNAAPSKQATCSRTFEQNGSGERGLSSRGRRSVP